MEVDKADQVEFSEQDLRLLWEGTKGSRLWFDRVRPRFLRVAGWFMSETEKALVPGESKSYQVSAERGKDDI